MTRYFVAYINQLGKGNSDTTWNINLKLNGSGRREIRELRLTRDTTEPKNYYNLRNPSKQELLTNTRSGGWRIRQRDQRRCVTHRNRRVIRPSRSRLLVKGGQGREPQGGGGRPAAAQVEKSAAVGAAGWIERRPCSCRRTRLGGVGHGGRSDGAKQSHDRESAPGPAHLLWPRPNFVFSLTGLKPINISLLVTSIFLSFFTINGSCSAFS
jgi:hypothetical protein